MQKNVRCLSHLSCYGTELNGNDIYINKVVISVCLFVCPIITLEP